MNVILKGILKHNKEVVYKRRLIDDIDKITKHQVKAQTVCISCMDCRVLPSKFVNTEVGKIYFLRNAGNIVPHFDDFKEGRISSEGAGLELGCVTNQVKNVVVLGHSDCRAAQALFEIRHSCNHEQYIHTSPMKTWVALHGAKTIEQFCKIYNDKDIPEDTYFMKQPMNFTVNLNGKDIQTTLDPCNKFNIKDKFSMLHCLQQASHVQTYPMLKPFLDAGDFQIHALWYDVYTGDVYMFSTSQNKFIEVNEKNIDIMNTDIAPLRI
ncbi:carbonic anhydrase1 [Biomphalaria pfeifferi]|uniref:Carbonic anhydrase n=1 Tax=Biomphalaria pfeifferi TaxID=112525 RepID=A0AAD8FJW6_BIOPF|nr:carbonic anhydrase1 [Biomphalaria pfeifferi]